MSTRVAIGLVNGVVRVTVLPGVVSTVLTVTVSNGTMVETRPNRPLNPIRSRANKFLTIFVRMDGRERMLLISPDEYKRLLDQSYDTRHVVPFA